MYVSEYTPYLWWRRFASLWGDISRAMVLRQSIVQAEIAYYTFRKTHVPGARVRTKYRV